MRNKNEIMDAYFIITFNENDPTIKSFEKRLEFLEKGKVYNG